MAELLQLKIHYYAVLREQRGLAEESLSLAAGTPGELYSLLRGLHHFTLAPEMVRAAVNGSFAPMDRPLVSGDTIVFIPPIAGG